MQNTKAAFSAQWSKLKDRVAATAAHADKTVGQTINTTGDRMQHAAQSTVNAHINSFAQRADAATVMGGYQLAMGGGPITMDGVREEYGYYRQDNIYHELNKHDESDDHDYHIHQPTKQGSSHKIRRSVHNSQCKSKKKSVKRCVGGKPRRRSTSRGKRRTKK